MSYIDRNPREIRQHPEPNYAALTSNWRDRDPAEQAPDHSRAKFRSLEVLERDYVGVARARNDAFQNQREKVYGSERRVRELERAAQTRENAAILAAERAALAALKKELAELEEQRRVSQEKAGQYQLLMQGMHQYLEARRGNLTASPPPPEMKLPPGQTAMDVVLKARKSGRRATGPAGRHRCADQL